MSEDETSAGKRGEPRESPEKLGRAIDYEWRSLTEQVLGARAGPVTLGPTSCSPPPPTENRKLQQHSDIDYGPQKTSPTTVTT